jgi:AraC-like DNA-binding protein
MTPSPNGLRSAAERRERNAKAGASGEEGWPVRQDWLVTLIAEVQRLALYVAPDGTPLHLHVAETYRYLESRIPTANTALEHLLLRALAVDLAVQNLYRNVTRRVVEHPDRAVTWVPALARRARHLIDSNFAELTTVSNLARQVACHPVHLERVFRRAYGTTVHRYLQMVRVQASLRLLTTCDLKISAIPLMVGFKGRGTFYRAVQQLTGHAPGYWRDISHR